MPKLGRTKEGYRPSVFAHEHLETSRIGEDAPVARLVGVGQRAARNRTANAQVIQLSTERAQARFDVARTLAIRELRKGHGEKSIPARKTSDAILASIPRHAAPRFVSGNEIHQTNHESQVTSRIFAPTRQKRLSSRSRGMSGASG